MKLPTLNIDAKLNTRTAQKDAERLNKQLQQIGGKATAFAGGFGGKLGALGSLGGVTGTAFVGAGVGIAAMTAGLKMNRAILNSFSESVKNGATLMDQFNQTGSFQGFQRAGVGEMFARRLEAALPSAQQFEAATSGFMDSFWAAAMDSQGNIGGVLGSVLRGSESAALGTKGAGALAGAILGGKDVDTARTEAVMALLPGVSATGAGVGSALMGLGLERNAQGQSAFSQQAAADTNIGAWIGLKFMELFS